MDLQEREPHHLDNHWQKGIGVTTGRRASRSQEFTIGGNNFFRATVRRTT